MKPRDLRYLGYIKTYSGTPLKQTPLGSRLLSIILVSRSQTLTRGGEGLVNCYMSTRTIGMHLRHRATHIRDVTIRLIVLLVH